MRALVAHLYCGATVEKVYIALRRTAPCSPFLRAGLNLVVASANADTDCEFWLPGLDLELPLFAALNYLEGKLITRLAARHRHQEWLALSQADRPAEPR